MAGKKGIVWFALDGDRPLAAFAGIYTPWSGTLGTKKDPIEGNHAAYGFLTTEPNAVIAPFHVYPPFDRSEYRLITNKVRALLFRSKIETKSQNF